MNKFFYYLVTLTLGLFIHLLVFNYFSLYSVSPDVLLLMVIAHGFLVGPFCGELMGFAWGLMLDSMGIQLFGLQALMFTSVGYISGKLRRRVDSERPTPQIVIAVVATICILSLGVFIRQSLDESTMGFSPLQWILKCVFNGLLVTGIFWLVEKWVAAWNINSEHL